MTNYKNKFIPYDLDPGWLASRETNDDNFIFCIKSPKGFYSPGHQSLYVCTKNLFLCMDLLTLKVLKHDIKNQRTHT